MKPDAAERLRQLEAEVQRLKEQIVSAESTEEPAEAPPLEPEGQEPPRELTTQEQDELDNLIKQAQLAKIRKQNQQATDLLKKAAALAPGSSIVLEALGDDLMTRHNVQGAIDAYAKAKKLDPTNIALDKKHADAVFLGKARAAGMMVNVSGDDVMASGTASIFISLILPGVGQMVRGKWAKGIIILVGFLVSLAILITMRTGDPQKAQETKMIMLFPLAAAIVFWLWGFLDSQSGAKTIGKRQINRPVPPVDLPFE